jgi:hypothetical protein
MINQGTFMKSHEQNHYQLSHEASTEKTLYTFRELFKKSEEIINEHWNKLTPEQRENDPVFNKPPMTLTQLVAKSEQILEENRAREQSQLNKKTTQDNPTHQKGFFSSFFSFKQYPGNILQYKSLNPSVLSEKENESVQLSKNVTP